MNIEEARAYKAYLSTLSPEKFAEEKSIVSSQNDKHTAMMLLFLKLEGDKRARDAS